MKKIIVLALAIVLLAGLSVGCGGGGETQPKTSTITVSVFDEGGSALSGVFLVMGDHSGETGDSGKCIFDDVESASYTIYASKDGYEDESESIAVSAGESKTVSLTLKKVEETAETLKNYSTEKSYKLELEGKSGSGKISKIIILYDDYGKSQYLATYEGDKKEFELYIVDDKAKVSTDGEWMDIPFESVEMLAATYRGLVEYTWKGVEESYNKSVTIPGFSYTVEEVGRETVNGYPATKYHMSVIATSEEGKKMESSSDVWIINSGPYKGYPTRIVATTKSGDETVTTTMNISDFGKDMGIQMP